MWRAKADARLGDAHLLAVAHVRYAAPFRTPRLPALGKAKAPAGGWSSAYRFHGPGRVGPARGGGRVSGLGRDATTRRGARPAAAGGARRAGGRGRLGGDVLGGRLAA